MQKPMVDYRGFRFSRLNDPRFSHLKLLGGWIIYFALYFLTENLIPAQHCHVVHCRLDDLIPFHEGFVIPYVLWYLLVAGSLLYFALYNTDTFKKLMTYIIVTQVVAMAIYLMWPSQQLLRPEVFPRENLLTRLVQFIYAFDTSTNVCPSLHVAYSIGIASVWTKEKDIPALFKGFIVLLVALVCLSTVFIKQHSAVDFFAALPVCLLAEYIAFRQPKWYQRLMKALKI